MLHQDVRRILRADFQQVVSRARCVYCDQIFKVKGWRKRGHRLDSGRHGQGCDRCRELHERHVSRLTS